MNPSTWDWNSVAYFIVLLFGAGLVVIAGLLLLVIWRVRRIDLPRGAGFATALRAAPLSVVLLLDALDWSLDIFSAPITWLLLDRLGLAPLRGVAVVKDLIPFDNFIPAMTLAWLAVRVLDLGESHLEPAVKVVAPPLLPGRAGNRQRTDRQRRERN
ncbi:MAG: hypothetical protein ACM3JD_19935 [Rudaea sp.]